jgi:hypothetical protein
LANSFPIATMDQRLASLQVLHETYLLRMMFVEQLLFKSNLTSDGKSRWEAQSQSSW